MRFLASRLAWLLLPLLAAGVVQASGPFAVQSAFVNVHEGIHELDARVIYPLTDDVRTALANGATVRIALQAVIERQRRYWLDATLVDAILHRELSWNSVSQRYILRDLQRGEQDSFVALDEALSSAGVVKGWKFANLPALDADASYKISVRAAYRSSKLPDALRALAFWSDGWSARSEWKSWILPH